MPFILASPPPVFTYPLAIPLSPVGPPTITRGIPRRPGISRLVAIKSLLVLGFSPETSPELFQVKTAVSIRMCASSRYSIGGDAATPFSIYQLLMTHYQALSVRS